MAMTEVVRSALRPLAPAYIALLERAIEATRQDERVRALWLGGSLARGQADAASDLDLLLAVQDEETAAFSASWRDFLSRIAPTVIARPVPFLPGVFYSVTASGERLDLVVEPVSRLPSTLFRSRLLVLDKDGLAARVPEPASAPGPSRERIAFLVEEFFRDHGMLHVSITRGDLLLGIEGIHVLRGLLYQLFCEANAPLAMAGMKQWSAKLTARQREVLEALPTGGSNLAEMVEASERIGRAFLLEARAICAEQGVAWPSALEATTWQTLRAHGLRALLDEASA